MNNIEVVKKVLENYGCQDNIRIANDAKRLFNYTITPQSVSAAARKLINNGEAGCSKDGTGKIIYWLNKTEQYIWTGNR